MACLTFRELRRVFDISQIRTSAPPLALAAAAAILRRPPLWLPPGMKMSITSRWLKISGVLLSAAAAALLFTAVPAQSQTAEPIKIGFGMALTGPLAANGKMSLVAMQVWEDDINAKGG